MYVKRHEQFEIGCGAILNKIYYYYLWPQNNFISETDKRGLAQCINVYL